MAYVKPLKNYPIPQGTLCGYGCGQLAIHWFKRPKKYCCSETANGCPHKKRQNAIAREIRNKIEAQFKGKPKDLEYIRALYPQVIPDITDGTLRWNEQNQCIEARCTHFECELEWFVIPQNHIGFRKWALSPAERGTGTKGGDGYRYYC